MYGPRYWQLADTTNIAFQHLKPTYLKVLLFKISARQFSFAHHKNLSPTIHYTSVTKYLFEIGVL